MAASESETFYYSGMESWLLGIRALRPEGPIRIGSQGERLRTVAIRVELRFAG
jgi:hypothetical protein